MVKVKNADYEEYRKYRDDLHKGRIMNPDGIRFICQANEMDPVKIGNHFIDMYSKFKSEGLYGSH